MKNSVTNIEKNSVPLRIYLRRENLAALSGLCERLGVSLSAVVNASVKVGLQDSKVAIIQDAKGAKKHG